MTSAPGNGESFFCFFFLFDINPFCLELGADLLGKVLPALFRMHEIRVDLVRDPQVVVHNAGLKFQLQDLRDLIISHGAQDPGLNGLSFHGIITLLHVR